MEKSLREKVKYFVACLKNTNWGTTATEATVDSVFKCALDIQENFSPAEELIGVDFRKAVDVFMESAIKNQHLNERLTLYAINKYTLLYPNENLREILDCILGEIKLRECLFELNEELADVDLDLMRINNFLCDVMDGTGSRSKMLTALNTKSRVVLNSANHSSPLSAQAVVEEMICCLETQPDLKLWFGLMKKENLEVIIELCSKHDDLFAAVLKFFDKFADEIESNYDEDLNVKYSHVNLDFDEFVNVFRMFLSNKRLGGLVGEHLNGKSFTDKNYCFWIDVKSCLETVPKDQECELLDDRRAA